MSVGVGNVTYRQATSQNLKILRSELRAISVAMLENDRAPRSVRLAGIVVANKRSELYEVVDELDVIAEPLPAAVVIWAGSLLTSELTGELHAAYQGNFDALKNLDTEIMAGRLAQLVGQSNTWQGLVPVPADVHQALDQEISHAQIMLAMEEILKLTASPVTVYRPPTTFFIRPEKQDFPNHWSVYGTGHQPLIAPPIDPAVKTVLITVGHGSSAGRTHFPSAGLQPQTWIRDQVGLTVSIANALCIPLQCFPQAAVHEWTNLGGTSVSINAVGKSDDVGMAQYVNEQLIPQIGTWAI